MVSRAIARDGRVDEVLVHTGQHYDENMSEIFFAELGMRRPDVNLGVGSGSHAEQTGRMLMEIERLLIRERPDCLLVYGDTNSTLAAALAGSKLGVPIAHVEAGLRSFNRRMPEEINRVLTDHLSRFLFTPTEGASLNLSREGVDASTVHLVGDVMYDAVLSFRDSQGQRDAGRTVILATVHRAENTDDPKRLRVVMDALARLARSTHVVMPLHPRTRARLSEFGIALSERIEVLGPVGYLEMSRLEAAAACILTDSGGVQKEAFFHGVPCVTLRDETEWVELVESGWNRLAPPIAVDMVVEAVEGAIGGALPARGNWYGDGAAADRVARTLASNL
jgi:UDP-GlcNAc3NAcA epimerase